MNNESILPSSIYFYPPLKHVNVPVKLKVLLFEIQSKKNASRCYSHLIIPRHVCQKNMYALRRPAFR